LILARTIKEGLNALGHEMVDVCSYLAIVVVKLIQENELNNIPSVRSKVEQTTGEG